MPCAVGREYAVFGQRAKRHAVPAERLRLAVAVLQEDEDVAGRSHLDLRDGAGLRRRQRSKSSNQKIEIRLDDLLASACSTCSAVDLKPPPDVTFTPWTSSRCSRAPPRCSR